MIRCITLYRRRDYKRRRLSTTFVPASYTPVFSGCNTILRRRLEEDDSDSQSDSDKESEFDDPDLWPEMFDDEDSNNNDAMEMVGAMQDGQSTLVTKDDVGLPPAEGGAAASQTKPNDNQAYNPGKEHEVVGRATGSRSRGKSIRLETQAGVQEGTTVLETHIPKEDHDKDEDVDDSIDYDYDVNNDNNKNTNRSIDTKNASNKGPGTAFDSPRTTRSFASNSKTRLIATRTEQTVPVPTDFDLPTALASFDDDTSALTVLLSSKKPGPTNFDPSNVPHIDRSHVDHTEKTRLVITSTTTTIPSLTDFDPPAALTTFDAAPTPAADPGTPSGGGVAAATATAKIPPGTVVNTVDTITSDNSTGSTTVVDTIATAAAATTPSGKTNTTTMMLPQPSPVPVPPPLPILPTTTTTQLPDVDTSKENVSDNAQHEADADTDEEDVTVCKDSDTAMADVAKGLSVAVVMAKDTTTGTEEVAITTTAVLKVVVPSQEAGAALSSPSWPVLLSSNAPIPVPRSDTIVGSSHPPGPSLRDRRPCPRSDTIVGSSHPPGPSLDTIGGSSRPSDRRSDTIATDGEGRPSVQHRRVPKEVFLAAIRKKMFRGTIQAYKEKNCVSSEEATKIDRIYTTILEEAKRIYDENDNGLWKLSTSTRKTKYRESGIYYGRHQDGRTKFGSSINIQERIKLQTSIIESFTVMTMQEIEEAIPNSLVLEIMKTGMPALQYHPNQEEELKRTIYLQVAEGLIGCAYPNDCNIFFEKLVQMPTKQVRNMINLPRMKLCIDYANCIPLALELEPIQPHIEFNDNIQEKGIRQAYSWKTIKSQNVEHQHLESASEFVKSLRSLPEGGGFLTNRMAQRRCGTKFESYIDAVPVPPATGFIDKYCVEPLKELFEHGNPDPASIVSMIDTVTTKNFDQYMHPDLKELGDGTKRIIENFLNSHVPMIQTQTNNMEALLRYHSEWFEENFDLENQLNVCSSSFIQSKDGEKRLVVHPAHFLIFSHITDFGTRLRIAEDYCLHLDLMIANNHIDLKQAKEDRLRLQCFFMTLTLDNGSVTTNEDDEEISAFHLARNCVFPQDWFKNALPGIRATARALGIHEQVLMYLREQLGATCMRTVVEAFGLMKGNSSAQLAPYEPGARCHGTPTVGSIPAKPCADPTNKENYFCNTGANSDNHPFAGYFLCRVCYHNSWRSMRKEYLRQNGKFDELESMKENHAAEQARSLQRQDPVEVRIKRLNADAARVSNPVVRNKRNLDQRTRDEEKRKKEGTTPKSRTSPYKSNTATGFRYPETLRNKMKQAVYILVQKRGWNSINNTDLTTLLHRVRHRYGDESHKYYTHEYNRCKSPFFEPAERHSKSRTTTAKYKPTRTTAGERWLGEKSRDEILDRVVELCFDETKMQVEKAMADGVAFGRW